MNFTEIIDYVNFASKIYDSYLTIYISIWNASFNSFSSNDLIYVGTTDQICEVPLFKINNV